MAAARERDRFIDALRVFAVAIVVLGHWFVLIPYVGGGRMGGRLLYQVQPEFWPLTWAFEVLPLLFFAGGFSNYVSFASRAARGGGGFRAHRLRRLLTPTLVFVAAWAGAETVLQVLRLGTPGLLRGMRIGQITPFESLWFVPVYLVIVLVSPWTLRLHRRFGWGVPVSLLAGTAVVDVVALRTGVAALLLINLAFVWLLPHQLGYLYADGRLAAVGPVTLAAVVLGGLGLEGILTSFAAYGRNLLDSGHAFWGVTAPTLPFAVLSVWMVAAAMLVRSLVLSWLRHPAAWALVERLNAIAMTLFLWHMTAYFAVLLILAGRIVSLPGRPDATWWAERPIFLLLPAVALVPLVWGFGRFETRCGPLTGASRDRVPATAGRRSRSENRARP